VLESLKRDYNRLITVIIPNSEAVIGQNGINILVARSGFESMDRLYLPILNFAGCVLMQSHILRIV
jgi:hypothetical protein